MGVILTGMGEDGKRGSVAVTEVGGRVIVQDEATSTVWGMPGAVAHAGLASFIGTIPELVEQVRMSVFGVNDRFRSAVMSGVERGAR
jgi:two-component system chemotaxis response regulator CheB